MSGPDLTGELELSVAIVRAKIAVDELVKVVDREQPQFSLIASNAMRSVIHLERCLQDHYVREAMLEKPDG